MKTLEYQIQINAPAEKVWNTMLQPVTYQQWTQVSWPGSLYKGKWEEGEEIRFISANGSGMLAIIRKLTPYQYLSAEHMAVLLPGGIEDKTEAVKIWIGTMENYIFTASGKTTLLKIEIIANPACEEMFNDGWPKALVKLKEICER
jgi:uncharacterized protein YndB with AHSA1/START domain